MIYKNSPCLWCVKLAWCFLPGELFLEQLAPHILLLSNLTVSNSTFCTTCVHHSRVTWLLHSWAEIGSYGLVEMGTAISCKLWFSTEMWVCPDFRRCGSQTPARPRHCSWPPFPATPLTSTPLSSNQRYDGFYLHMYLTFLGKIS